MVKKLFQNLKKFELKIILRYLAEFAKIRDISYILEETFIGLFLQRMSEPAFLAIVSDHQP